MSVPVRPRASTTRRLNGLRGRPVAGHNGPWPSGVLRKGVGCEGHHCRRRDRRAHDGPDAACPRHRLRAVRAVRGHPRARRRHQHPAARHQGVAADRPDGAARRDRHPHPRADLHQPLRPGDLARAPRHRCRLRRAAILRPSRPAAGRDPSGGALAARRKPFAYRASARRVQAGRERRDGLFLRPHRLPPPYRSRRRPDRRRRHPFICARHALSERRPGALERFDAVARRDGLAEVPHRPLHGDCRGDGGQARGLSDRRGRPRGPAADQLGGAGEGRRGRRAAEQGRLVAGRAASRT